MFPGHFLSLVRDKEILNFTRDLYAEHLRFRGLGLSEVFIKAQTWVMVYVSSLETPFSTNIDKNAHPYTFPSHGFLITSVYSHLFITLETWGITSSMHIPIACFLLYFSFYSINVPSDCLDHIAAFNTWIRRSLKQNKRPGGRYSLQWPILMRHRPKGVPI